MGANLLFMSLFAIYKIAYTALIHLHFEVLLDQYVFFDLLLLKAPFTFGRLSGMVAVI